MRISLQGLEDNAKAADFLRVSSLVQDIFEQRREVGDNAVTGVVVEGNLVDEEVEGGAFLEAGSTDQDVEVGVLVEHHYFYLRMAGHSIISKEKIILYFPYIIHNE